MSSLSLNRITHSRLLPPLSSFLPTSFIPNSFNMKPVVRRILIGAASCFLASVGFLTVSFCPRLCGISYLRIYQSVVTNLVFGLFSLRNEAVSDQRPASLGRKRVSASDASSTTSIETLSASAEDHMQGPVNTPVRLLAFRQRCDHSAHGNILSSSLETIISSDGEVSSPPPSSPSSELSLANDAPQFYDTNKKAKRRSLHIGCPSRRRERKLREAIRSHPPPQMPDSPESVGTSIASVEVTYG